MIKLNLGSGKRRIPGFIHVDADASTGPDVVADIVKISDRWSGVDLIYASHSLEHLSRVDGELALGDWFKALRPGGVLRLAVPDLEQVAEHYVEHRDLSLVLGLIYGGQKTAYDHHITGYDFASLRAILLRVGFSSVERYDWRRTEHAQVDDYSQAYLPHMDKERGRLMSLNVEAVK